MKLLTKEEMEKLSTKRLLAYKAKLLTVQDNPPCSCADRYCDYFDERDYSLFTKSHPDWKELYNNVKSILNNREHVERS